jgi:CRP/FNR family nitrogen fixation transcriptional regulator
MLMDTALQADVNLGPADVFTRPVRESRQFDAGSLKLTGHALLFGRNEEIYGEGAPAEHLYKVISGAVRTYRILADGRRQIQAFHGPGDVFGFEFERENTHSAEAIVKSRVLLVRRGAISALAERNNDVACQLWALTARELRRMQDHGMLLVKTARERVVSFLLEMAARGPAGQPLMLPMSRQDIADYLGLTIETVSRTLTSLESDETIELPNSRQVVLRDHAALRRLSS